MRATHAKLTAAVALAAMAAHSGPASAGAAPPPDLIKLEKLVSLELAHVRDTGPTDPVKRKMLFDAKQLDQQGEDALKAGDYKSAEDNLLKARVILRQLKD